jgi:hypothetical protein
MKTRLFWGLLAFGLVIVACDTGNGGSGGTDVAKSVKIENITNLSGQVGVFIFAELPQSGMPTNVAIQYGTISESTLSVDLVVPRDNTYNTTNNQSNSRWTGTGDYYVAIMPVSGGSIQGNDARIFTNGGNSSVKVTFDKTLVTLDFGKFK